MIAITGGGGALGQAVIARLERDGATVSAPRSSEVDLLDAQQTQQWADSLTGVTALVHLVGGWKGGVDPADTEWLQKQLLTTVQNASRAFLEPLKANNGRFVIVSSKQALEPTWSNAAYAAAKAAAEAWTFALADEITANVIAVNAIVTPEMRAAKPDAKFATFTDAAHIADAIAFLLSPAAEKMNGQRLALHG
ncbi:SDR family NAD(P)-dependent oxidoreductase [Solirubrobacter phytolaccae]|uniref:SDR family NAD(P)-dependent oxidoreductase n=1 Tax=Solirubrobacter phytolaccae TaxID=1404360 RepID=A0A9X3N4J4_9ACTN|nr:SDR family NAD(P)-dependent oxidoreductase [Solirubrobacter phytolaccae]MDA0179504.1 SDR family NAD(P)-dependent oxidoreductase [Solirubrobacter phytolaccae]